MARIWHGPSLRLPLCAFQPESYVDWILNSLFLTNGLDDLSRIKMRPHFYAFLRSPGERTEAWTAGCQIGETTQCIADRTRRRFMGRRAQIKWHFLRMLKLV